MKGKDFINYISYSNNNINNIYKIACILNIPYIILERNLVKYIF